ncbi:sugar dehydrogenase complex small subunit [Duganella sp. FT27W]|uniref:sugar dehydrogenase complex small subunit n=1 Tax=Duganella sp. FT27W TaxID=2654636 RepID=UPI00128C8572|nr:sugar dehydrogenase complex small subunit [Duganella sp. FT27W]MPQ57712.1 dehydrogenase [Duganella sp. FT27W]
MALSRRKFLLGATAVSGAWVTWGALPAWGVGTTASPAQFLEVSKLLINHQLDEAVGARIAAAAATKYPQAAQMMTSIAALAQAKQARQVEDFFGDIPEGPLQEFAHWVIFAWYSGCSSPKKDAQLFTFEHALTYKTTADTVAMPSYGFSGPNLWSRPIVPLSNMPIF